MNKQISLPVEVINHILSFRPRHPLANIVKQIVDDDVENRSFTFIQPKRDLYKIFYHKLKHIQYARLINRNILQTGTWIRKSNGDLETFKITSSKQISQIEIYKFYGVSKTNDSDTETTDDEEIDYTDSDDSDEEY
jgi:hypothetical protein